MKQKIGIIITSFFLVAMITISFNYVNASNNLISYDNSNSNFTYEGDEWIQDTNLSTNAFLNGDYMRGPADDSKVKFNFSGTTLKIYCQPWTYRSERIQVKIDGMLVGEYSQLGDWRRNSILMYEISGLEDGEHSVELHSIDPETGRQFGFDYISVDGALLPFDTIENNSVMINDSVTGTGINQIAYSNGWSYHEQLGAYENDETYTNIPGSYFQIKFSGRQIKWFGAKNDTHGRAAVYIDEQYVAEIDTYQPLREEYTLLFESKVLSSGEHTLTVMLLPFKAEASLNTYITVDRIQVIGNY